MSDRCACSKLKAENKIMLEAMKRAEKSTDPYTIIEEALKQVSDLE